MNVMVTGGSGFIGSNLLRGLNGKHQLFAPGRNELDLLDPRAIEWFFGQDTIDAVIHCATWNPVTSADKDTDKILENNLRMFFNLARAKDRFNKFICLGSGADFSKTHWIPSAKEDYFDTHVPADAYGFSKYVINKHIQEMPNTVNLRLFGVFGRGEDWRIRFISNAICMAINDLSIRIFKDVLFDYFYVDDLARIVEWFLENEPTEKTYNVCTGKTHRLSDIAEIILDILGKDLPIEILERGDGIEYSGDNSRLKSEITELWFTPIREAVSELASWYDENRNAISHKAVAENHVAMINSVHR